MQSHDAHESVEDLYSQVLEEKEALQKEIVELTHQNELLSFELLNLESIKEFHEDFVHEHRARMLSTALRRCFFFHCW